MVLAAKNEAKEMSLSPPFKPEEYETILPYMKEHAEKNGISFYHEKELIVTDLFGNMDLSGIWVFIIYKDPVTLEKCLKLKEDKAKLLESGSYEGEARRTILVLSLIFSDNFSSVLLNWLMYVNLTPLRFARIIRGTFAAGFSRFPAMISSPGFQS